jgi:uncharacterized Ntn-hydrolase superfamily protein
MAFAHTYSIVARCPQTGALGVAVQSHWFAVGTVVPWAESEVGAVATQSMVQPSYGPEGLAAMRGGLSASDALAKLVAADEGRDIRQVAMVDANGKAAAWTGPRCVAAAGQHVGDGYSVQANMMTDQTIWPAMAHAYETTSGPLVDRLLAALDAAQAAGGDARGKQSAAILIVGPKSTGKPWLDRLYDLRVDDSEEPLVELRRLVRVRDAYHFMDLGDQALEKSDITGALEAYSSAEKIMPQSSEMVFWHAIAEANAGRMEAAVHLLRRCCEMDSRWVAMTPRVRAAGLLKVDLVP